MAGPVTLYRATVVDLAADPRHDSTALRAHEDGALAVADGHVVAHGPAGDLMVAYPQAEVVDRRGSIIVPGFIDAHIHYPQTEMIAAFGEQLLQWLSRYTFPTEARFDDPQHAATIARVFFDELLRNGTTTAVVLGSVHRVAAEALFGEAERRRLRIIAGPVMMDRNAPQALCDTAQSAYDDGKALIERWHERPGTRLRFAVTPRFAATSSPAQLDAAAQLRREHPGVYMHTHWAENHDEIEWIGRLFPEAPSYLGVYEQHGLLGPRSLLAHGVHPAPGDEQRLLAGHTAIAFCPSSNLFLGSGLFDLAGHRAAGIPVAIGTDVGAGTSFSILRTLADAYKVAQLRRATDPGAPALDVAEALYLATLGGARALDLGDCLGNFEPGKEADFVVLDPACTPLLALRCAWADSVSSQLFAMLTMGDDRCVAETYIWGQRAHARG